MNRSFINTGIAVVTGIVAMSCGGNKPAAPNPAYIPVPVNLYTVQAQKALYFDKFPGVVTATMQVELRPMTEGYVTGIYFTEGQKVTKGQKLYSIDDSRNQATYNQVQANARVAQANLDQAQKDADRYNYLNQHDAIAKQTLDHALTTLQNAKSQLAAANQDLAKAGTDLNYAIIKAPFDGTIGISQVRLGANVTKGVTILNTLSTDGPVMVDFAINEKQIPRFAALQHAKPVDSIFHLLLPDNTPYKHTGEIAVIDRGINPQTGTLTIRLKFPNPDGALRTGMSCYVKVRSADTTAQLVVPLKATVEQMGEYFVYTALDTLIPNAPNQKDAPPAVKTLHAMQKKVITGQTIGDKIIILSGLQEGEQVVVEGVQKLHDGSLITTQAPGGANKK
jgi:membrane fusion protein (multidrug efflux system)